MGSHHFLTLPPAPNFHLDLLEAVLKFSRAAKLCCAPTRRPTFLVTRKILVGAWQTNWTNVFLINKVLFRLQNCKAEFVLAETNILSITAGNLTYRMSPTASLFCSLSYFGLNRG